MSALFKSAKKRRIIYWEDQLLNLEQSRERILKEIERLEKAKIDAFEAGRKETNEARRIIQAQNIKKADNAIKTHNDRIVKINQQIEFVDKVILGLKTAGDTTIKDFEPVVSAMEGLSDAEHVRREKFETARAGLEASLPSLDNLEVDPQTREILEMFEKAEAIENRPGTEAKKDDKAVEEN